jgi:hypothetical protein
MTGAGDDLYGIWGTSSTDVFAVGANGAVLHYDGNTWDSMPTGVKYGLTGVWGSSGTDVFAVGTYGMILYPGKQSTCSTWSDVIGKYNAYVSGSASWTDVIDCYNQYISP